MEVSCWRSSICSKDWWERKIYWYCFKVMQ